MKSRGDGTVVGEDRGRVGARDLSSGPFVKDGSVVRRIWGDADLVLLVFAGAAAEFALNRAVGWLFFTGRLPRDPLGRLFSTAAYAQQIVFSDAAGAEQAFRRIRSAHAAVEGRRGERIPDWAHRDVLYLLVDYSERAYQAVHAPLTPAEREELWDVFRRVGLGLGIPGLPPDAAGYLEDRARHLERDLLFSRHTGQLYAAYRRALGPWRFWLLREVQAALVPPAVRRLLDLPSRPGLGRLMRVHPLLARLGLHRVLRRALIPPAHFAPVMRLDHHAGRSTGVSWRDADHRGM